MRLLVLGGTRFVGWAVVEQALADGHDVTVVNRGQTGATPAAARLVTADRRTPGSLRAVAGDGFDIAVDAWSEEPRVVADAADTLAGSVGHYVYVSTRSVYADPLSVGADEAAPVVEADPDAGPVNYPVDKRGAELAVLRAFGPDRSVFLRAGLILGPHEDIGRLPWWLRRIERGGRVLAPGPPDLPLQYVDARDLADFALRCGALRISGAINTTGPPGVATMRSLLEACRATADPAAELVWTDPAVIATAGIHEWTELPIWIPPDSENIAMHSGDVSRAIAAGLQSRPIADTVQATWEWMTSDGEPPPRPDRPIGLDPGKESAALAQLA